MHLSKVHKLDYLFPSQKKSPETVKSISLISNKMKKDLDNAVLDAILIDGRSFLDFCKPGMMNFLKIAIPGN